MSNAASKDKVNRLLDMVVEEVSLVDRAANKRRFLIVKRSQEMAEDLNVEVNEQSCDQGDCDELPADINTLDDGDESTGNSEEDADLSVDKSPIEQATKALEQLGGAVAALAEQQPESLNELGAKLRQVADMVSGADMGEVSGTSPHPEVDMVKATGEDQKKVLDSLRRQIEELNNRLNGIAQKEAKAQPKPAVRKRESSGMEQIGQLTRAVSSLAKVFQSHQRRLSRMEKSYGLPNSLAVNERIQRDVDSAWPMDLNSEDL